MTSCYLRDHLPDVPRDEYERLGSEARGRINNVVAILDGFFPVPPASGGELTALRRACARFLIDSGKATEAGQI